MSSWKALFFHASAFLLAAGLLPAQTPSRVFVPASGSQNVPVLDATTLANVGVVAASLNTVLTLGTPDGSRYYLLGSNTRRTLTMVNGSNLSLVRQLDLPANASGGAVTPDGKLLLVAAGTLRIYNTATDQEVANVPVGGGPTEVAVNNDSSRAYVMSTSANLITVVNLSNFAIANQINVGFPLAMALTPDGARLLVLTSGNLLVIDTATHTVRATIPVPVLAGKLLVTPDSALVVVVNTATAPENLSQIVNVVDQKTTPVGGPAQGFEQIVITDATTAFGRVSTSNAVAKIDLTTGAATTRTYGLGTRAMDVSPNGKILYLASFENKTVTRVDIASNLVLNSVTLAVGSTSVAAIIPPPISNPASMAVNGGNRQILIPGRKTPVPLSVRVTTSDGSPVFNLAVTFATITEGAIIDPPAQPVRTNSRGIAQAFVTAPTVAVTLSVDPATAEAFAASERGTVEQSSLQNLTVTATGAGTGGALFQLTISSGTGLVAISGDFQITSPNQRFALPLVTRCSDESGAPVPKDTDVLFIGNAGVLPLSFLAKTDTDGFARAQFSGATNLGTCGGLGGTVCTSSIIAGAICGNTASSVSFVLTTAIGLPNTLEVLTGDGQSADAGKMVPFPLQVQLKSDFGPVGLIGVYWSVVSGPAGEASAVVNQPLTITGGSGVSATTVNMGPTVGLAPVIIRAMVPLPNRDLSVNFSLRVTGGPPERVTIVNGDTQEGRPGTNLPVALRVKVLDFFGNPLPFPTTHPQFPLRWEVSPPSAATLSNLFSDANGEGTALVTLGNTLGQFTVIATCGNGRAVFNLRVVAAPAAMALVSGNNQPVPIGGTSLALVARVNDNAGNPVAGIPVTFNGPASLTFVPAEGAAGNPVTRDSGADGRVSVTVRIAATAALGPVTINASSAGGNVSFTINVVGRLPVFTAAAVVNAGSFRPGLVPLGLATLFGTGLSQATGEVLPGGATTAQGVTLTVGGRPAPLFAIVNKDGREQINFQAPGELTAGGTTRVELNNNGAITSVDGVPVVRVQPGMFEYVLDTSARHAVVVKLDGSLVGPTNPAARGSIVLLFWTGGGPTTPAVGTGQAAPSPPAVTVGSAIVGLNNEGQQVLFSGLTPGFVGLNQINFQISENAPVGQAIALDLVVDGVPALQTSRIAIQ